MLKTRIDPVERMNLTLSAGAVAASFALATPHFATSLALGAALEAINFRALSSSARALFGGEIQSGGIWVGVLGLRFVFLGVGIFLALNAGAHAVGLVIGLSIAMPAVVMAAWVNRPPVIPVDPLPPAPPDDPTWDNWSVWRGQEIEAAEEDEA